MRHILIVNAIQMQYIIQPAPIVDFELAKLLENQPDPIENLLADQGIAFFLTAISDIKPKAYKGRIVRLACGHYALTKALLRCKCRRCGEMIRSGYDYEGFRNSHAFDEFYWPSDPLRNLHEHPEMLQY